MDARGRPGDAAGRGRQRLGHLSGPRPRGALAPAGSHLDTRPRRRPLRRHPRRAMAIEVVRAPPRPRRRFGSTSSRSGTRRVPGSVPRPRVVRDGRALERVVAGPHRRDGTTLRTAFAELASDPGRIGAAARHGSAGRVPEAHIDRGRSLPRRLPAPAWSPRSRVPTVAVQIDGEAGTLRRALREAVRRAAGASEVALAVERLCRARHIIGTVGRASRRSRRGYVVPACPG